MTKIKKYTYKIEAVQLLAIVQQISIAIMLDLEDVAQNKNYDDSKINIEEINVIRFDLDITIDFQKRLILRAINKKTVTYNYLNNSEKHFIWKYRESILRCNNNDLLLLFINDFINQYHQYLIS